MRILCPSPASERLRSGTRKDGLRHRIKLGSKLGFMPRKPSSKKMRAGQPQVLALAAGNPETGFRAGIPEKAAKVPKAAATPVAAKANEPGVHRTAQTGGQLPV